MNIPSKIHLSCGKDELREKMQGVYFGENYAYATNGHILLRQSISLFDFSEKEKEAITGKYIHRLVYAELCKRNVVICEAGEDGVKAHVKDIGVVKYPYFAPDGKAINYDVVFEEKQKELINSFGLNL